MQIISDIGAIFLLVVVAAFFGFFASILVTKINRKRKQKRRFMKHLEPWRDDD